jgi:hypothetical protein
MLVGIKDIKIIEFMKMALSIMLHAFYCNQELEALVNLFKAARTIVRRFGAKIFFASVEDSLQDWMRITFYYCSYVDFGVRNSSCNFFLHLTRSCFYYVGSITLISNTVLSIISEIISDILELNNSDNVLFHADQDVFLIALQLSITNMRNAAVEKMKVNCKYSACCVSIIKLMDDLKIIFQASACVRRYALTPVVHDYEFCSNVLDGPYVDSVMNKAIKLKEKKLKTDFNEQSFYKNAFQIEEVLLLFIQAAEVYDPIKLTRFKMNWYGNLIRLNDTRTNKAESAETRWRIFQLCQLVEDTWQDQWVPRSPLEWKRRDAYINAMSTKGNEAINEPDRSFFSVLVKALDSRVHRPWKDSAQFVEHMVTTLNVTISLFTGLFLNHLAERSLSYLIQSYRLMKNKNDLIRIAYERIIGGMKTTAENGITTAMAIGTFYRVSYAGKGLILLCI